jgi:KaiC/GvpD/RAD55 family RecA-like ATPase
MAKGNERNRTPDKPITKLRTGVAGLDEVTLGGLPEGRPTLVCGGAGSGKTQLGMAFLVNGARLYNEPGVFVAFEETPRELSQSQIATRRIRVVKYRGSKHGTDEYPFLIDETGISVLPVTSMRLEHMASSQRVSSGIKRLDSMLSGKGYYKGATVLISGTAGTGKSTLATAAVDAACRRGERSLYFAFEESPEQIMRNMRSVGYNLKQWEKKGLLKFVASPPDGIRSGNASAGHPQDYGRLQTQPRSGRSHQQSLFGGNQVGHHAHADPRDRLLQEPGRDDDHDVAHTWQ